MPKTTLNQRLPDCWRRLDAHRVLERFLSVLDAGFDRVNDLARELRDLRSVDRIPDRRLHELAPLVGHEWRSDKSREWNRSRIRDAIRRHSYRGTMARVEDVIAEHGGGMWQVEDMASRLFIWNRQGRLSRPDSHLLAAHLYHPGAFVVRLNEQVDFPAFLADFEAAKPAGTVWYFQIWNSSSVVCDETWYDRTDLISQWAARAWGRWNRDLWLNDEPTGAMEIALHPIVYVDGAAVAGRLWNLDFPWNDAPAGNEQIEVYEGSAAIAGGTLGMDSLWRMCWADLPLTAGTPGNPLELDMTGMQEHAELVWMN